MALIKYTLTHFFVCRVSTRQATTREYILHSMRRETGRSFKNE